MSSGLLVGWGFFWCKRRARYGFWRPGEVRARHGRWHQGWVRLGRWSVGMLTVKVGEDGAASTALSMMR